jgi:hypothetical protein
MNDITGGQREHSETLAVLRALTARVLDSSAALAIRTLIQPKDFSGY